MTARDHGRQTRIDGTVMGVVTWADGEPHFRQTAGRMPGFGTARARGHPFVIEKSPAGPFSYEGWRVSLSLMIPLIRAGYPSWVGTSMSSAFYPAFRITSVMRWVFETKGLLLLAWADKKGRFMCLAFSVTDRFGSFGGHTLIRYKGYKKNHDSQKQALEAALEALI